MRSRSALGLAHISSCSPSEYSPVESKTTCRLSLLSQLWIRKVFPLATGPQTKVILQFGSKSAITPTPLSHPLFVARLSLRRHHQTTRLVFSSKILNSSWRHA